MWACVESARAAPCARGKHAAAVLGAHLYVLGGRGAGGALPLRDFWRYCLATGQWERVEGRGEAPPALQEHTATAHAGKLYVFGGEAGSSSHETPLWIYDSELRVWRKLPGRVRCGARRRGAAAGAGAGAASETPGGRRGHSAHALQDCLLIYGGYMDLRGSTNELWAFHYESERWRLVRTARAGPARHRHAAALLADRLYVHGGQCDLRDCADLWHYDIVSRVWTCVRAGVVRGVRGARGAAPGARSGHAGLRAGAHLYIFGGEARGHATNEMWRFHFATETWERIEQGIKWPPARVDGRALLVGGAGRAHTAPPALRPPPPPPRAADPPGGFLREISKLSSFHVRRATRCSYSVLAGERDSTESLAPSRSEQQSLSKSRSAYIIDGGESPQTRDRSDITREPKSVPNFADMVLAAPELSPVQATKLVYLDSEGKDLKKEFSQNSSEREVEARAVVVSIPKSASVRFTRESPATAEEEADLSTSDYASAERVNGISGALSLGFSNPHYLGPDIRNLGIAVTPDSGVGPGDIELQDLGDRRARSEPRSGETQLHLLLVGGKEAPHPALLQSPLSMWTYRLL